MKTEKPKFDSTSVEEVKLVSSENGQANLVAKIVESESYNKQQKMSG